MNRARPGTLCALLTALALRGAAFAAPEIPIEKMPKGLPLNIKSAVEELYSMDPITRGLAAGKLAKMGDAALVAIPFLVAMLHDAVALRWVATLNEDPLEPFGTRREREERTSPGREAAKALIRLGNPSKAPLLDALAKDPRLPVTRNAAYALGLLKETRAAALLVPWVDAERLATRAGVPRIAALPDEERTTLRSETAQKLDAELAEKCTGELAEKLKAALDRKLKDEDSKTLVPERVNALREGIQKQVKDELVKKLRGDLVAVRVEIVRALGRLKDPAAVEALIAVLGDLRRRPLAQDADWEVRREAAIALGALGDARAVGALIARLDDRSEVRGEAEKALMDIHSPAIVGLALEKLKDDDPAVRRVAVRLLGKFRERRILPVLIEHVRDAAPDVQFEILAVLHAMSGQNFPPLPALWNRWWEVEVAGEKLNAPAEKLADVCLAALKEGDWATRVAAARRLGGAGDKRAVPDLIGALTDKEPWARKAAAQSLGALGDPHAVEPLIRALKDTDGGVQLEAQLALRSFSEQDFGRDTERWLDWWNRSKEALLAKAAPPAKPESQEAVEAPVPAPAGQASRGKLGILLLLALIAVCPIVFIVAVRWAQRKW